MPDCHIRPAVPRRKNNQEIRRCFQTINKCMENIEKKKSRGPYKVKSPSRGGARANSGRPKGSTNKIRIEDLLGSIEHATGMDYAQQLASNYVSAITREDWRMVGDYDKAFLNKIVADKQEVEINNPQDSVEAKAQAFADAIAALTKANKNN